MDSVGHPRQGFRVFDTLSKNLAGAKNDTWPSWNELGE